MSCCNEIMYLKFRYQGYSGLSRYFLIATFSCAFYVYIIEFAEAIVNVVLISIVYYKFKYSNCRKTSLTVRNN